MAKLWIKELPAANGAWIVTPLEISELTDLTEDAQNALDRLGAGGAGAVNNAKAREAFSALTRFMRALHKRKFFFPPMTDSDWHRLGLKPPDTIPTPQPVPSSVPEIEANTSVIRRLRLRLRDTGAKSWSKPNHVQSMELKWDVKESRPAHVGELTNVEVATKNPINIFFEENKRGSRVYFAARWLNNTAQGGPWSDIESAFVP
jgi:hypothetical protein